MRKRHPDGRALATVSKTTADVLDGTDDLSQWDDEEIRRGQRRAKDGTFRGAPPKLVPQAVHAERHRRTLTRAHALFTENVEAAVQVLVDLALDTTVPPSDRIKAALIVAERVMGKNPQAIEVAVHTPKFMQAIAGAIVSLDVGDDYGDDDVIDAELVD